MVDLPKFRTKKALLTPSSPVELFSRLPNREKSHGYLRQPQADVLRDYVANQGEANVALELPTGTGKTLVGLLIAEWRRQQSGEPTAFLTVTNQLARQVLKEAVRVGIDCADLTGNRDNRSQAAEGSYKSARAVGVTTYSNLFNVNPVIRPSNVLVLDDAHGGEQAASDMWTVRVSADVTPDAFHNALNALRPTFVEGQLRTIFGTESVTDIELIDLRLHPECIDELVEVLDEETDRSIRFQWSVIRNHLGACLVFASARELVIRPLTPPTYTHASFAESRQRIYMSATLGGEGDLLRGYGLDKVRALRADNVQWGHRYIFTPELVLEEDAAWKTVAKVFEGHQQRRAVLLAPSTHVMEASTERFLDECTVEGTLFGKGDVEEALGKFTSSSPAVLALAGRYDGLDLPGDDCRLLVLSESPTAVGPLEKHLKDRWKMGPVLRRRERTRLVQGLGRCTRDATDYAIIFLMGQSLVDSITSPALKGMLPGEIQRELAWGLDQGEAAKDDENAIAKMALGLLNDDDYRKAANTSISELDVPDARTEALSDAVQGAAEAKFNRAMWSEDYTQAYQVARQAVDVCSGDELAGYRAWWLYLASRAAALMDDPDAEVECLHLARKIGINPGYLDKLLRARNAVVTQGDDAHDVEAEAIWTYIETRGWKGPSFAAKLNVMRAQLAATQDSTQFHMGLEELGQLVGATTMRPTDEGAPDVIWIFPDTVFTFEAKSSKLLSKKYLQQAKGHPDWVKNERPELKSHRYVPVVVSPEPNVDAAAKAHTTGLHHLRFDDLQTFAARARAAIGELRVHYSGKDYGAALQSFKAKIRILKLSRAHVDELLGKALTS